MSQDTRVKLDKVKEDSLRIQAAKIAHAPYLADSFALIKYSYSGIIDKFFEGKDNVGSALLNGKKDADEMGFRLIKVEIGNHEDVGRVKNEIYTFIKTFTTGTLQSDTLKSESSMLAISQDEGLHWYFIDASFIDVSGIKTVYPNYDDQVAMPTKKQPIFIKNSAKTN